MEDQQAKMNRPREIATLKKDAATGIHTRPLKQFDTLRKSESSRTAEGKVRTSHRRSMTGNPYIPW